MVYFERKTRIMMKDSGVTLMNDACFCSRNKPDAATYDSSCPPLNLWTSQVSLYFIYLLCQPAKPLTF